MIRITRRRGWTGPLALAGLWACLAGCGFITDKDRIRVAKIDDEYITRGDLYRVIRETTPEEKPLIRTKGDLLRVLNTYIDDKIKRNLAEQLESAGKIYVQRELAEQQYDATHPDSKMKISNPKEYGLSDDYMKFMAEERQYGIEQTRTKLLGEAAVAYRRDEAWREGTLAISDAEYVQEYTYRKDSLKQWEAIAFRAICFPTVIPGNPQNPNVGHQAVAEAAKIRRRIEAGEQFDSIAQEYYHLNPNLVFEAGIENNPNLEKFRGFWLNASGAERGDIIGPVFMPTFDRAGVDEQGRAIIQTVPDSYFVLQVLQHAPERVKTLAEAKPELAPAILYSKVMERLREERGVEVYEDKIPDPSFLEEMF
ncbi:MAG: hypothetical protein HY706_15455 [Candidatus Hydrogenedentes bacterium]|nr:hypothetical protein [Candidatus Hydrogenedentota bacterium]